MLSVKTGSDPKPAIVPQQAANATSHHG